MTYRLITLKPYIPLFAIIICSLLAWYFGIQNYLTFDSLREHQKILQDFISEYYLSSLLIFSGLYITVVALSIPGAAIMTVTAGFLFGQIMGTLLAVISATIGATILFLSARLASKEIMVKKTGRWVKKMQAGFHEDAFSYLVTLRLIPLFPFVAINLVASLLQIPLKTFFFGTLLGIIPGSFVFTSIGVALRNVIHQPGFTPKLILDPYILVALVGLGFLSLLPVIYKKYKKKR